MSYAFMYTSIKPSEGSTPPMIRLEDSEGRFIAEKPCTGKTTEREMRNLVVCMLKNYHRNVLGEVAPLRVQVQSLPIAKQRRIWIGTVIRLTTPITA